jgi:hypothetical protein
LTFASAALGARRQCATPSTTPLASAAMRFHAAIEPVLDRHCAASVPTEISALIEKANMI